MLTTEWDWDIAREVWEEEAREEKSKEIARNALEEGLSVEFIEKITGLSLDTIERIRGQ
jgi:predicted transposase YdaD